MQCVIMLVRVMFNIMKLKVRLMIILPVVIIRILKIAKLVNNCWHKLIKYHLEKYINNKLMRKLVSITINIINPKAWWVSNKVQVEISIIKFLPMREERKLSHSKWILCTTEIIPFNKISLIIIQGGIWDWNKTQSNQIPIENLNRSKIQTEKQLIVLHSNNPFWSKNTTKQSAD